MKTRAIVINQYGGADQLVEETVELPELEANQVVVKVKATSVNPIDWKLREGYLRQMMPWEFPIILGSSLDMKRLVMGHMLITRSLMIIY